MNLNKDHNFSDGFNELPWKKLDSFVWAKLEKSFWKHTYFNFLFQLGLTIFHFLVAFFPINRLVSKDDRNGFLIYDFLVLLQQNSILIKKMLNHGVYVENFYRLGCRGIVFGLNTTVCT